MKRAFFFAPLGLLLLAAACSGERGSDPGGECSPACGAFQSCCERSDGSYACARLGDDMMNCGMCGLTCAVGQRCMGSMCTGTPIDGGTRDSMIPMGDCRPTCASSQRCCGTTCLTLSVPAGTNGREDPSFMNCNGCGLACDAMRASACSVPLGMSGAPRCMCGNFNQCGATEVCVMEGTAFRCINTGSDVNNCGEVGHRCATGEICSGGECHCGTTGPACAAGEGCCAGACRDVSSDDMNCGGCGTVCPMGTTCGGGECLCGPPVTGTDAGMGDADGGPGDADGGAGDADGGSTDADGGTPADMDGGGPGGGGSGGGGMGVACAPSSATAPGEICCAGTCVAQDAMNCGMCGFTCDPGDMCVISTGFPPGTTPPMACCGTPPPIPGFPVICSGGGFPGLDGGAFP